MKLRLQFILLLTSVSIIFSCKKDNYEAPSSSLTGRLIYNGEPIQVDYDRVPYELYQYGFGRVGPINGAIAQEGTYSQLLFDGAYKFVIRPGQGPFIWPETGGKADSVSINVSGNTVQDIEVQPYHMIRTPQFSFAGGKISATFRIEKIITGALAKDIEVARLFVNKTAFVGTGNNLATADIAGGAIADPNSVSLEVTVPTIVPTQNYMFARVGVKTSGVEDWIFSPVEKLSF